MEFASILTIARVRALVRNGTEQAFIEGKTSGQEARDWSALTKPTSL
jgi:hypothetical protein